MGVYERQLSLVSREIRCILQEVFEAIGIRHRPWESRGTVPAPAVNRAATTFRAGKGNSQSQTRRAHKRRAYVISAKTQSVMRNVSGRLFRRFVLCFNRFHQRGLGQPHLLDELDEQRMRPA